MTDSELERLWGIIDSEFGTGRGERQQQHANGKMRAFLPLRQRL